MEAIATTLGLNVPGLIWHAINFIVLLVLLRLVLYKPVVGMLDARAQRVRDSMEQAEAARREPAGSGRETARAGCDEQGRPAGPRRRTGPGGALEDVQAGAHRGHRRGNDAGQAWQEGFLSSAA